MKFTKKHMVEDYERLYNHADLLELYMYDTQTGVKPVVETHKDKEGSLRVSLYRPTAANGGYVVIMGALPNIWLLDEISAKLADDYSIHTLGLRTCLERLRVARHRAIKAEVDAVPCLPSLTVA